MASHLALLSFFVAMATPHAVAVRGVESDHDPFAFDLRHQLVDAEIGLDVFVGGETAGGVITVAAAGRCCRCNYQSLQISHGAQNFFVLHGGGHSQRPHHDGASGG